MTEIKTLNISKDMEDFAIEQTYSTGIAPTICDELERLGMCETDYTLILPTYEVEK